MLETTDVGAAIEEHNITNIIDRTRNLHFSVSQSWHLYYSAPRMERALQGNNRFWYEYDRSTDASGG